jgi:hypothetical protein
LLSLVERLKTSEAKLVRFSEVEQKNLKFEKKKEADEKRIADLEYVLSIQVGLHRSEIEGLEKKLDEITENFNVEQTKREISDIERSRVQKNVEELRQAKEELSHPGLRNKAGCILYMRQEDNIYNNRVYRDKCHKTSEYLLHSGRLITK